MRYFPYSVALGVAVASGFACAPDAGPPPADAAPKQPPRAAKVRVAKTEARALNDTWRFLGDVRADARANVGAGEQGTVASVVARLGQPVKRGQLLVEIDPDLAAARLALAQAELDQAAEALAQAKREVRRLKSLRDNVVPELERERAASVARTRRAGLASAKARLQEAKATLARHRIRAPFAGVVARRIVDPGDWVNEGDRVLELVSTEGLDIVVDASRALLGHVRRGTQATLVDGAQRAPARVTGVVPALDPVSRTLRIRLVPAEPTPWLLAGSSLEVEFKVALEATDGQVAVPVDALLSGPTETRVVKVVDGLATPLVVEVLAKARGSALVRSKDLADGDEVVIRGNERLRPGQSVEVVQ